MSAENGSLSVRAKTQLNFLHVLCTSLVLNLTVTVFYSNDTETLHSIFKTLVNLYQHRWDKQINACALNKRHFICLRISKVMFIFITICQYSLVKSTAEGSWITAMSLLMVFESYWLLTMLVVVRNASDPLSAVSIRLAPSMTS